MTKVDRNTQSLQQTYTQPTFDSINIVKLRPLYLVICG